MGAQLAELKALLWGFRARLRINPSLNPGDIVGGAQLTGLEALLGASGGRKREP